MTEPAAVVHAFLDGLEALNFDAAAGCLAENGFSYHSPLSTSRGRGVFMADLSRLESVLKRIERHQTLSDESQASVLMTLHTNLPDLARTRIALWATVHDGRITRLEFVYDASVYAGLFEFARG